MAITPLPDAPLTTDNPVVFNTKAFAWVASLGTFTTQANALAVDVSTDALAADASKIDAQAAAASAVAAANATKWVSGTSYAEGAVVWSPITFLSYRRKTAGSGTTDPSLDSTNWAQVAGTGDVTLDATQTLTNKTLTSPIVNTGLFTGSRITVSALGTLTTGTTTLDLATAQVYTATITASDTITIAFSNAPSSGQSQVVLLRLIDAGGGTIVWPANTKFTAGTAPTLTASGVDVLGVYYDVTTTTYMVFVIGLDVKVP
jgi:hypothetical protein